MEKIVIELDFSNIDDFKKHLCSLVDKNTENTIFSGFTFDSHLFSLSLSAQINWSNLFNIPNELYPLTISCKDESIYQLSLANKQNFYLTALNAKNTALQNGTVAKSAIMECVTIEELNLIAETL